MSVTKALIGKVPTDFGWDFIDALIDRNFVYGRGSLVNARRFEMGMEMSEALEKMGVEAETTRRERAQLPLDVLHRYCSDRKTTRKLHLTVQHGRRVFHAEVFEHKPNSRLRFKGEMAIGR